MDGQTTAVTQTTVAADFAQPLNVHADFTAQVALDGVVILDGVTQQALLILGQILNTGVGIDLGDLQNLSGPCGSDAVDISQRNFNPLVAGKVAI